MIIPLRTDRPPRRRPVVTEGLILLNVVIYVAGLAAHYFDALSLDQLLEWTAFNPREFRAWQLFTSMFMHDPSSIWHLAFNMLFLWVFGSPVEDRLGRIGFLGFYLIGGAVAALAHSMISSAPVIGASGAIAAVTGAFLALFPRSRIIVLFLIGFSVIALPSLWFIGLYFVIDVLRQAGEILGSSGNRVAYMAHIAGYIYGFALAFLLLAMRIIRREEYDVFFLFTQARRRAAFRAASRQKPSGLWESATSDTGRRLEQSRQQRPMTEAERHVLEARSEINRLASAGDLATAAAQYRHLLANAPEAVFGEQRQLELANQLYAAASHDHAARAYELLLSAYPKAARAAEVRLMLGVLYTRHLNRPERAREMIGLARPDLHDSRQRALADELLAELNS